MSSMPSMSSMSLMISSSYGFHADAAGIDHCLAPVAVAVGRTRILLVRQCLQCVRRGSSGLRKGRSILNERWYGVVVMSYVWLC